MNHQRTHETLDIMITFKTIPDFQETTLIILTTLTTLTTLIILAISTIQKNYPDDKFRIRIDYFV